MCPAALASGNHQRLHVGGGAAGEHLHIVATFEGGYQPAGTALVGDSRQLGVGVGWEPR